MSSAPEPPYLIIRPATSFWVEQDPVSECTATVQAFEGGCFDEARCYDGTGGEWLIEEARLLRRTILRGRFLPWIRVPVALRLGPRREVPATEVVSRLTDVLRGGNQFCDHLGRPPEELLALFHQAESAAEIIRIAELACD